MKVLSWKDLEVLAHTSPDPAVSIYMPTSRKGNYEQDPIRLGNLLREAETRLTEYGLRTPDSDKLLEPARQLLDDAYFWQHQADGLAVFSASQVFEYYTVPLKFDEMVVVADGFHIKPLLPLFTEDEAFYVLAVSENHLRLLQCSRYSVRRITPDDVPSSLAEALQYDQPEKQLQFHSSEQGGGAAIFHGHGISKDYEKDKYLRYFQKVNKGLQQVFKDDRAPLVLAGVDYLHPIYRKANTYRYLMEEGIEGNPDELKDEELQQKAWLFVQPYLERRKTEALARYHEARAKGLATDWLEDIVLGAADGRVATLFVTVGKQVWGRFDEPKRTISLYEKTDPGAEDLLDVATVETLARGGVVYALKPEEMPGEQPAAAILRY